jgi:hypothetical protein
MNNNKKYVHWKTIKNYQFTDKQLELVIGSMLGDAMLEKVATCQSRFVENHSYIQKGWLDYKGKILEPFSKSAKTIKSMGRKRQANKIVYDFSKEYKGCKLRTMRHPIFTELEYKWYRRDKQGNYVLRKVGNGMWRTKILPNDLKLTAFTLAVWYLDDGHNPADRKECHISTLAFTEEEVKFLVEQIMSLGISDCCHAFKDTGFQIIIRKKSYINFLNLVSSAIPDMPACMQYKLNPFTPMKNTHKAVNFL